MSRIATRVDPDGLLASTMLAFLATAGMFYVNIMAALVDGLVTGLGFSNAQAGNVVSANVYGAAVGALVAVFTVKRLRWRAAAWSLLAGLIVIDAVSMTIHQAPLLTAARALHGTLGGLLVGVAYSVMARLAKPDRVFGMLLVVQYGLGGLGNMWLPKLVPAYGAGILFVALVAFSVVALVMMACIPEYARREVSAEPGSASASASARSAGAPSANDATARHPAAYPAVLIVSALAAMFLFQAGNMGLGAYILGLARHDGLDADFASNALGYATWIGMLGAVACVMLGTRKGRFGPLLVAMLLAWVGTYAFHHSESGTVYALANSVTAIMWAFVVPYLFGMCAQMDRDGQLAVLCGFCSKMGLATGPFLAGRLLVHDDYGLLVDATLGLLLAAALLAIPTARALDRHPER